MTKKPSYRFVGFEDEWEQQKASKIFYSVSDKNHVDLPVLSASQEHGMVKRDEIGIDIKYDKASVKTYKRVKPGQFVIHLRSFQGGFAHSYIEGITSPAYTVLNFSKSNKHFDLFWKEVFTSQNFIKRLETVTYGIRDGRSISFSDFSSLKLQFPSLPEQTAIGSFFQDIDQLISLQQRKLEVLKEQKKTYLKLLFPAKGQTKPALRFAGFEDEWKEVKLGKVATITMGQSPNSENYTDNPNDYILVQGNADMKNGRVFPRVWTTQITKQAKQGNLILSVRAPVGDIGKTDYDVVLGRGVASIDGNEFLYQVLSQMKQNGYWSKLSTGSTFESINSNDIKSAIISLPSLPEQEVIGSFFQDLDKAIAKQEEKVNQLKESKQTLLRKMFI